MDTKTRSAYVYKRPFSDLGHIQTESEGWKKIFHTNVNDKKAEVVILISDDVDFKTMSITKNKEGHYVIIHELIQKIC